LSPRFDARVIDDAIETAVADRRAQTMAEDEGFFLEEQAKLEAWADEARAAGKLEIEAMGRDLRALKAEIRRAPNLEASVAKQREVKALEARRRERQMTLYDEEVRIEEEQDDLLGRVEKMMSMNSEWISLGVVEWTVA